MHGLFLVLIKLIWMHIEGKKVFISYHGEEQKGA